MAATTFTMTTATDTSVLATMTLALDAETKNKYEAESLQLRLELKTWETAWARDHDGAKPGRADIKQNGEIAQKYTAYNRLRSLLSGKETQKRDTRRATSASKKRKAGAAASLSAAAIEPSGLAQTPSKRLRAVATPMKNSTGGAGTTATAAVDEAGFSTPSISRKLFSPVAPTSIGPTPQRDGRVLGLFDFLDDGSASSVVAVTPSKTAGAVEGRAGMAVAGSATMTPRKQILGHDDNDNDDDDDDNLTNIRRRLGRTPMSSAKRNLLDRFTAVNTAATGRFAAAAPRAAAGAAAGPAAHMVSPLQARSAHASNSQPPLHFATPTKKTRQEEDEPQPFATPAFLRRTSTLPAACSASGAASGLDENGSFVLSPPSRLQLPRKPLMRGLSSVLASLRKMEDEQLDEELDVLREMEAEEEGRGPVSKPAQTKPTESTEPTEQNDRPQLLSGFDDEGLYDSTPEEQTGRDGQPLRVFKKKGQKRTTRLLHMRPTRTKRPAAVVEEEGEKGDEKEESHAEDDHSDGDYEELGHTPKKRRTAQPAGDDSKAKTEGPVKRAARKVNELAHANFKRLKLRNFGSKGGPGCNSRFRRRR